jgi:hypothetical protein
MKTPLLILSLLLGVGFLPARSADVVATGDPDLPQPVAPDDLTAIITSSPFTRSLNLSDSLVLTGIAYINGKPVATLLNKETKENFVVSQEPNAQGWRLAETNATVQLNRAQAKIMIGSEVVTVRYSDEQLNADSMKKGGFKPGGGSTEQGAGERRSDGPHRDGPRPTEEDRQRFMALSEKSRSKFIEKMRDSRDKMMNASPEERMQYAKKMFERVEAEDKADRGR